MSDIIKIKKDKCFIDSDGLATLSNIEARAINQLIKNRAEDLERFGSLSFEMIYHGEGGGRPKKLYLLSEQQATLLTTFMKNSDTVREFKYRLVDEFFKMREYIQKQNTIRLAGIEVRKSLTDTVRDSGEQERMHGHGYSTYTNMVYEITGLKDEYKRWKIWAKANNHSGEFRTDALNTDELKRVELAESLIKPLLELDKQYSEIKETLKPLFEKKEIT